MLILDQNRLEPPLQKMAVEIMPAIKPNRVGGVKPLHGRRKIALRRADQKMIVVAHQAEGEDFKIETINGQLHLVQKIKAVFIRPENALTVIPP